MQKAQSQVKKSQGGALNQVCGWPIYSCLPVLRDNNLGYSLGLSYGLSIWFSFFFFKILIQFYFGAHWVHLTSKFGSFGWCSLQTRVCTLQTVTEFT